MIAYEVEPRVFEMFPAFRRGVVVATGIDNRGSNSGMARLLSEAIAQVGPVPSAAEEERIAAWNAAYKKFGADPKRYTPSIQFLYEQIRRGKPPRSINPVVDAMNLTSIRWMLPCGGDDLDSVDGGDLRLGLATGEETFAPLFKPLAVEHPNRGEVIYYTPQTKRVLCRRWTWRNADFSKLTPETHSVAINVDAMIPPFTEAGLAEAMSSLVSLLQPICAGATKTHILSPLRMRIEIEI